MDKPTGYATVGMLMAIAKNFAMRYGVTNIEDITLDPSGNGIQFILTTGDTITVPFDASELPFIPGSSGLTANNVQDAIYEVKEAIKIPCIIGASDPTTATVGEVGQFYLNTTTNKLFQCQSASGGSYIWGVPNVNAVTLGTETQTFEGTTKILRMPSGRGLDLRYGNGTTGVRLIPDNNTIRLGEQISSISNYLEIRQNQLTGRYANNNFTHYFPTTKSGTLALTSDIPDVSTKANESIVADAYDNTQTYTVGDIVIYNNTLYKCTTAVSTAEDFDSAKWTATTLEELIPTNAVTLGTEEQTFEGNKGFTLKNTRHVRFKRENYNNTYTEIGYNNIYICDSDTSYTLLRYDGTFFRRAGNSSGQVYMPAKNGTLALTSDIPTLDSTPTQNSTNGVTSGGVYDALALKQDTMTALTNAQIDTIMDAILV